MAQTITALTERLSTLSGEAQVLRSKDYAQPDDMLRLAKILSRKAQTELQMRELGVTIIHAEAQPMITDENCPF